MNAYITATNNTVNQTPHYCTDPETFLFDVLVNHRACVIDADQLQSLISALESESALKALNADKELARELRNVLTGLY